jgi:RNA polymerase sigma-70 factor, ECF subfamily
MTEAVTEDAALAEALVGGNIQAARELYRRHRHPIMRFAMAMIGNRAAAEDVVHDTFVELLHRPGAYNSSRGSMRAFLYGIARHRIAKSLRGPGVVPASGLTLDEEVQARPAICETPELAAVGGTPDELAEHAQDIECLRTAIKALPLRYREVLVWYDLEQLPYATIADMLDCPIGTVRSRLHRARALLFAALRSQPQSTAEPEPDSCQNASSVPSCTYRDSVLGGGSA